MSEVTVKQLAEDVGAPVERLLAQIEKAGLGERKENDKMTNEEKQELLAFLRKSHGESDNQPKKITLKRKKTTTLKLGGGRGSAKTVNVEVRKKRTYVKRENKLDEVKEVKTDEEILQEKSALSDAEAAVQAEAMASAEALLKMEAEAQVEAAAKAEAEAKAAAKAAEESKKNPGVALVEPVVEDTDAAGHRRHKKKEFRGRGSEFEDGEDKAKAKGKGKGKAKLKPVRQAEEEFSAIDLDDDGVLRPRKLKRKKNIQRTHVFEKPVAPMVREVSIGETIVVSDLADKMSVKAAAVIKTLIGLGVMATVNQAIDQEVAVMVVEEMGHTAKLTQENAVEVDMLDSISYEGDAVPRAPVISVMGHVDHGKTSLLDYIRKAKVAAGESGGITQHIGAYHVDTDRGMITFLDTPGHAAFTAMRARGAQSTDIVILVVAADDGVMPQTEEAIQHAKSAGVPIIVAINKIDKENADPDRVKNELAAKEVIPEDWGGDVQFVNVSAHSGEGIDELLDAVLLQAELQELTAVVDVPAKGVVIESRLDKGRGSVATVLVQNGTLKRGDIIIAGTFYGRIRALLDENGQPIDNAGPSIPVEILGLNGTPDAGDAFFVVADERKAREVASFREAKSRKERHNRQQTSMLEGLFDSMGQGEKKTLNIVLKTDVRGSLEALTSALAEIGNDEVQVKIISSGVGGIAETDASLALASNAMIIGFNVRADASAKKLIEDEGLELRYYSVIYDIIDHVKQALTGMLAPKYSEDIVGIAEVRDTFRSPKFGQVAGCMVVEGTIHRNKKIRVLRDNVVIFEGELESLRRFKDDVSEVRAGVECGIGVKNYDVKIGDKIEVFDKNRVERTLD